MRRRCFIGDAFKMNFGVGRRPCLSPFAALETFAVRSFVLSFCFCCAFCMWTSYAQTFDVGTLCRRTKSVVHWVGLLERTGVYMKSQWVADFCSPIDGLQGYFLMRPLRLVLLLLGESPRSIGFILEGWC